MDEITGAKPASQARTFYVPTFRVSLVRDGSTKTEAKHARTPADAARILRACMPEDADRETFAILLLDIRHKGHRVSRGVGGDAQLVLGPHALMFGKT